LDRIPGRVFDEDLLPTDAGHDLVAEARAGVAQPRDQRLDVLDLELEAVPATGLGHAPVRHRRAAPWSASRRAQHEAEIAAREHREGGRRVHVLVEAELTAVEGDRGIYVVDDVADADFRHDSRSVPPRRRPHPLDPPISPGAHRRLTP